MPSVRNRLAVTAASRARKGAPSPRTEAIPLLKIPDSLKEALHSRYSRYSGAEIQNRSNPIVGNWVATRTNCSGARYGSGAKTAPYTTVKTAMLAPTPRAMTESATSA